MGSDFGIFHSQLGIQPQTFSEIRGQPYINVLVSKLKKGIVSPIYLMLGPNGTGKTVTAKVLTRALLCESPVNGIDPCGQCESCKLLADLPRSHHPYVHWCSGPQLQRPSEFEAICKELYQPPTSSFRVVVIDEASSLDSRAKNTILVLTEDPTITKFNVFILCTMQPEALGREMLDALSGRGTPLLFNPVPVDDILSILHKLALDLGVQKVNETSLKMIATAANGSVRQALQLMESVYTLDNELGDKATMIITRLIPKVNRRAIWEHLRLNNFLGMKQFIQQHCAQSLITPENFYRSLLADVEEALLKTKDIRLVDGITLLNRAILSPYLDPIMVTYQLQPYAQIIYENVT